MKTSFGDDIAEYLVTLADTRDLVAAILLYNVMIHKFVPTLSATDSRQALKDTKKKSLEVWKRVRHSRGDPQQGAGCSFHQVSQKTPAKSEHFSNAGKLQQSQKTPAEPERRKLQQSRNKEENSSKARVKMSACVVGRRRCCCIMRPEERESLLFFLCAQPNGR